MTTHPAWLVQNPTENQQVVAEALGLPAHRVFCHAKRLGGGFGGKEILPSRLSGIAAVAAWKARRPVRLCLDRDEDMHISGQRHAFLAQYKVCTRDLWIFLCVWCLLWSVELCAWTLTRTCTSARSATPSWRSTSCVMGFPFA